MKVKQQKTFTPIPTKVQSEGLHRKCACGNHSLAGDECADCHRKRPFLQRQATNRKAQGEVSSIVREVLRSPGQPLNAETRAYMEPRFGHDFSQVRVHTDVTANRSSELIRAQAYTIGHDVVFGEGTYQPATTSGRRLIAHELTHVAAQDASLGIQSTIAPETHSAEIAARHVEAGHVVRLPRVPVGIYRSPMPRADFERQIMRRFDIRRIFNGTFEQQRDSLNYLGAGRRPGDLLLRSAWMAWSPGPDSPVYDWIISAFSAFARRLGGVPAVQDIGFYATDYGLDSSGVLVAKRNVAAAYGGGHMAIYQTAIRSATSFALPAGRSASGAASRLVTPTQEEGVRIAVTHELGHGLVETALTPRSGGSSPDPNFMRDYFLAAGWTAGSSPALYDAGVTEVRAALTADTTPRARYRITRANWNDPRWIEQPVSQYMTTHPSEDLPEAVAVYVNSPDVLRQRSPRRFAFIESHKATLRPFLRRDLATVRLRPTVTDLQRAITPPWMTPVPTPQPTTPESGSRIRFRPGPMLEIRF